MPTPIYWAPQGPFGMGLTGKTAKRPLSKRITLASAYTAHLIGDEELRDLSRKLATGESFDFKDAAKPLEKWGFDETSILNFMTPSSFQFIANRRDMDEANSPSR